MEDPQNARCPIDGCLAGALTTAGVQLNSGAVLAAGWWEFWGSVDYAIGSSRTEAVTAAQISAGARQRNAEDWLILWSDGDLRVTMKSISGVAGLYKANLYE